MIFLAGPLHLLAVVLIVSGSAKLMNPLPASDAMLDAGLPVPFRRHSVSGTVLGVVETSVGMIALAIPAWWAAGALGAFYLALAAFVVRLRSRDGDAGCGCFGSASTPPGTAHVVLNVCAAAVAAVAVVVGVPDIVEVFDEGFGVAVPYVFLLAVGAGTLLVAPALTAQIARVRAGDDPPPFAPIAAGRTR